MKTLMLRQVRLLATPALVSVGLGLVPLVGMSLTTDLRLPSMSPAELALMLVALVAPWLLAVAAIAPDAESGALAFLGGLPLGRARHFALRAVVALGWSVVAVAPFCVLVAREVHPWHLGDALAPALLAGAVAFIAGLAAGAVARQSLGAFIAAPLLFAVPVGLYETFAVAVRAPEEFHLASPFVACGLLLVVGWLGFRDPTVGASWRPLVRASGLLLGAVVLGCGVTTAAWARARVFPVREFEWSIDQPGVLLRFETRRLDWPSSWHEWSTTLYTAAALERADDLDDLQDGWTFDERLNVLARTPDGLLLAHGSSAPNRLMLLDVQARRVLAVEQDARLAWPYSHGLFGGQVSEQALVRGEAWFVTREREVKTFSGRLLASLPAEFALQATGGTRLVGHLPDGERVVVDVSTGARRSLGKGSDQANLVLSPRGRYLLRWERGGSAQALAILDLDEDEQVTVPLSPEDGQLESVFVSVSPNDRSAVVSWTTIDVGSDGELATHFEHAAAIDLASGEVTSLPVEPWTVYAWSPSGRRLATYDGWLDLDGSPPVARKLPRRGVTHRFFDDDTLVCVFNGELERLELTASE